MEAFWPRLRFRGFTSPWEQHKLGEVAHSFEYGLNAAAAPYNGGIKYLRITDIDDETREFRQDGLTSPDAPDDQIDAYLLKEGDLLFARTGASVGKTYRYQCKDGIVAFAGFLIRTIPDANIDSEFLFQSTLTDAYKKYIAVTSQRSGQPGVNAEEYSQWLLGVPTTYGEQRQIGALFSNLDNLIALQQRRYDKLMQTKKAMLVKMFPKAGETVPEVRFKGFAGPWERRKLEDIATRVTEISSQPGLPRVEYEDINPGQGTLNKELAPKEFAKEGVAFEPGDVLYGKLRPYLMNWLFPQFRGIAVGDFWVLRPTGCDGPFLFSFIQSERFQHNVNISSGSKMPRADWAFVSESSYLVPKSRQEQHHIGETFQRFDSLITFHHRRLGALKSLKSALLDKMFV